MKLQEHLEYIRAGCLEEAKCGDERMSRKECAQGTGGRNRDQRITKRKDFSSKEDVMLEAAQEIQYDYNPGQWRLKQSGERSSGAWLRSWASC